MKYIGNLCVLQAALREQPPVVMLVGNKTDKQEKREVTLDDGHHLALVCKLLIVLL